LYKGKIYKRILSDIYDIYCICQQIKVKNTSFLINFENMYLTNCHKRDFNIVYINIILNAVCFE